MQRCGRCARRPTRAPSRPGEPRVRARADACSSSGWQKTGTSRGKSSSARLSRWSRWRCVTMTASMPATTSSAGIGSGTVGLGTGFAVLSIGGRAPASSSAGSTSTRLPPSSTINVAFRTRVSRIRLFYRESRGRGYTDRPFPWPTTPSIPKQLSPSLASGPPVRTVSSSPTTRRRSPRSPKGRSSTAPSSAWTRTRCSSTSATSRRA